MRLSLTIVVAAFLFRCTSTESENPFPLDSLLSFNSQAELASAFGSENVQAVDGVPNSCILFPGTKQQVLFQWDDPHVIHFPKRLITISLQNANGREATAIEQWKTKEGVYLGMKLKDLEELNGTAFTIEKTIDDDGGDYMWGTNDLFQSTGTWVWFDPTSPFDDVPGVADFPSSDDDAQKKNPRVYTIQFRIDMKAEPEIGSALSTTEDNSNKEPGPLFFYLSVPELSSETSQDVSDRLIEEAFMDHFRKTDNCKVAGHQLRTGVYLNSAQCEFGHLMVLDMGKCPGSQERSKEYRLYFIRPTTPTDLEVNTEPAMITFGEYDLLDPHLDVELEYELTKDCKVIAIRWNSKRGNPPVYNRWEKLTFYSIDGYGELKEVLEVQTLDETTVLGSDNKDLATSTVDLIESESGDRFKEVKVVRDEVKEGVATHTVLRYRWNGARFELMESSGGN